MNTFLSKLVLIETILLLSLTSIFGQSIKVACVGNSVTYGMGIENPDAAVIISRMTPIFTGHTHFESSTRDWYWQVQDAIEVISETAYSAITGDFSGLKLASIFTS